METRKETIEIVVYREPLRRGAIPDGSMGSELSKDVVGGKIRNLDQPKGGRVLKVKGALHVRKIRS